METSGLTQRDDEAAAGPWPRPPERAAGTIETTPAFHDQFVRLFDAHFGKLYRFLDRLSGEPELAADLAQEAFVRLYHRGSLPDTPEAWLITVAMNLFRSAKVSQRRRLRLLTTVRAEGVHSDPPSSPEQAALAGETRRRVRAALDTMPERERRMLLLRAEGYSYRDIAAALALNEASVGTLLARAWRTFRQTCEDAKNAP